MKYKVFHIVTHFDIGGSETVSLNISKANHPDFEFHFVEVVRGKGNYSDAFIRDLEKHHIFYHRSPLSINCILGALLFPIWFWKIHKKYSPDVYHTHTESPDVALYLFFHLFPFLIKKNIKVVRTLHNTKLWKKKHLVGIALERFFLKYQANVAISLPVKQSYLSQFSFYDKDIPIILNGIEEKQQMPFKHIETNKTNILFAGRLVEQKGTDILASVILALNKKSNKFFFHIIGDGPLRKELSDSLQNEENVRFYGNVYNLASYLGSFDYLFMPSWYEGLSMLSIESSFAKLPVIINSCEGLVDTVPTLWPLKVKNNDINAYLQIFENLDSYNRKSLSDQAYLFVSENFGIKQMQEKYLYRYRFLTHYEET